MTTKARGSDLGWVASQLADPKVRLEFDRERASEEFVDQLDAALQSGGISRATLAGTLGRSRAFITQTLRRRANLTIKTMAELAGACGYELHIALLPRGAGTGPVWSEPQSQWSVVRCEPRQPMPSAYVLDDTLLCCPMAIEGVPIGQHSNPWSFETSCQLDLH